MTAWLNEVLKISVRTSVSCSAQSFSTRPGILSGYCQYIVRYIVSILSGYIFISKIKTLEDKLISKIKNFRG